MLCPMLTLWSFIGSRIWYAEFLIYMGKVFDQWFVAGNEKMVGNAIKASGISRQSLYITTKLA
jgi:hypothetical protein